MKDKDKIVTHESIKFCIDMINQEPRYISELARAYARKKRIDFEEAKEIIHTTISYILETKPVDYAEYLPEHFTGSIIWNPYKILYNTQYFDESLLNKKPKDLNIDDLVKYQYTKSLHKKLNKIQRISEIGKKCSIMYENAVYTACKKLYPDSIKTDYNDGANPDVIIPSQKILVEASSRFENPIDRHYVWWKAVRWNATYEDYKGIIFIAPKITKPALELIKHPEKENINKKLIFIQYPETDKSHEGYPLFRTYKYYAKYFREVYRKVHILSSKQMVEDIIPKIRKAVKNILKEEG